MNKLPPKGSGRFDATYIASVIWIAENDNDGEKPGVQALADYLTVVMIADVHKIPPVMVARDVLEYRDTKNIGVREWGGIPLKAPFYTTG